MAPKIQNGLGIGGSRDIETESSACLLILLEYTLDSGAIPYAKDAVIFSLYTTAAQSSTFSLNRAFIPSSKI